jgi:hypothetical protein
MFDNNDRTTSHSTAKTYTEVKRKKKYTKPELPEGVAAKFYYTKDETICHLVTSEKPENHRVPKYSMQLHILAAGTAHTHPLDLSPEKYDKCRGEVISLGRALKMYQEVQKKYFYSVVPLDIEKLLGSVK